MICNLSTALPTKSDSDIIFCLQLSSKTLHLSYRKSIDHLCINPFCRIGLIYKRSIDSTSLLTL